MAKPALGISLIALVIAVLAYPEVGGTKDLARKLEVLRQETADGLSKMDRALRPTEAPKPKP